MTTVKKSIIINGTREDIRPFLHDPQFVMARDANIYHYQPDANWPAEGSTLQAGFKTFVMNVDAVFTSLEYDAQTLNLRYRAESQNNEPAMWQWTFDEQNGQTTVSVQIDYTLPGSYLGKALDKLFVERKNEEQTENTLAGLKAQVEGALIKNPV